MRHHDFCDDPDPACFDCARRDCDTCMEKDPAPPGSRACCCGIREERTQWGSE